MNNNLVLVGRVAGDIVDGVIDDKPVKQIKLAIPRSYKNEEGEYETDFIPVILRGNIATQSLNYIRKGDIVGVRGSILTMTNKGKSSIYVCVDKISFLSSSQKEGSE